MHLCQPWRERFEDTRNLAMGKFFNLRGRLDEIKGYRWRVYVRNVEFSSCLSSWIVVGLDEIYIYIYIYWWWTGVAIFYISLHRRNGNCFRELFLNVDRFLNIRRLKESDHYQVTFYIANKLLIHQLIRNDILDALKFNLIIQIYPRIVRVDTS